jgi:hypothetical protein
MKPARIASTIRAVNLERSTVVGAIVTGPWVGVKRHVEESPHSRCGELEHIGEIMRRLRRQIESEMTHEFSPGLSLRLDLLLVLEQCVEGDWP